MWAYMVKTYNTSSPFAGIQSDIFYIGYPLQVTGKLEPIGVRRGTPWTGRQPIAGLTHE